MKKLMFLLCTIVLVFSFTGISVASNTMVYDGVGGTWSDVNKASVTGSPDSLMCWAAAASDALAFTGWKGWDSGTSTYIDTAGAIYNKFVSAWPNQTGSSIYAYEWWMTNRTASIISGGPTFPTAGLNFYPTVPVLTGVSVTAFASDANPGNIYTMLGTYITAHRGIVASIAVPKGPGTFGPYSHAVSVWGWDPVADLIYITDSDDGKTALDAYTFYQSNGQVYIQNYSNLYTPPTNVEITELDRLNMNDGGIEPNGYTTTKPPITSTPEPTTMLLLGLGLIGVAGIRRKFKN
jgi:hypothetical protein